MNLTKEQLEELSEFYWETDISTKELQNHFKLPSAIHRYILPLKSGTECPNCGHPMVFKSRTSRSSGEEVCCNCVHKGDHFYSCRCDYCAALRETRRKQEEIEREERRKQEEIENKRLKTKEYEELLEQAAKEEYVLWALAQLPRREKIFLRALLQLLEEDSSPTWEQICNRAGVVSHKRYVKKLINIHLLLSHPDGSLVTNPAVDVEMINIQKVRNISKSLRFDVFQRDNHTCQYCGHKSPDVELEIDHLVPVAEGGTDDFENLVISCRDCNSGKSDKLIEFLTEGYSREEWREELRNQRIHRLEEKREKLEEVIEYWAKCRNVYEPSPYELDGIYRFIEAYDPESIKVAIKAAVSRQPSNYVYYVGGILKNWAQNGPPQYTGALKLDTKKATEKQVKFIRDLLDQNGLDLESFYDKLDYNELTMLDARNIIDALTEPMDSDDT